MHNIQKRAKPLLRRRYRALAHLPETCGCINNQTHCTSKSNASCGWATPAPARSNSRALAPEKEAIIQRHVSINKHMFNLMMIVQADLTEQQQGRLTSRRSEAAEFGPINLSLSETAFMERFCVPRSS